MYAEQVTVRHPAGLHARPATLFIQAAGGFKSAVTVEYEQNHTSAKSLLGVLALGINQGAQITIRANGTDEERAVKTLVSLIASDFQE